MEEQTTIILDKEQLLILCSAIIIAGMASNYSTVSPTSTHLLVAQGLAQSLLDSSQKESFVFDYIFDKSHRTIASYSINLSD